MSLIVDYVGGGSSSISLALGLNILSKPSKLFYIEGDHLDLNGLVVQFRNGAAITTIDGYTTIPANGAELKRSDKFIKISYAIPDTNDIITDIIPIEVIYPVRLNIEAYYKHEVMYETSDIEAERGVYSLEYNNGYKEYISGDGAANITTNIQPMTDKDGRRTSAAILRTEFSYVKNNETFKAYKDIKVLTDHL